MARTEKKKEPVKKETSKKVSKGEQKRLDANQATINQQKAIARNDAINMLDNVVGQVSLDRAGHVKLGNAITMLRGMAIELAAYESGAKTAKQKEAQEEG